MMKTNILYLMMVVSLFITTCDKTTVLNEFPDSGLVITSISPEMGGPGMTVEIEGLGFSSFPEENNVTFNGIPAEVQASSINRIITMVPEGVSTGPVNVEVGEETGIGPVFTLDDRLAFIGQYVTQDIEIRFIENEGNSTRDTTFTIGNSYRIQLELLDSSSNRLKVDIGDFVDQSFRDSFIALFGNEARGVLFLFSDQPVAKVNSDSFTLSTVSFEISNGTSSLLGEFSGEGTLMEGDAIAFNFIYKIVGDDGVDISLSGEELLERQE